MRGTIITSLPIMGLSLSNGNLQVKDLQTQGRIANYDHELCQVRAALGGEKAHLLDDLVSWLK